MIQSGADIKVLILDKGQRSPGHDLGSIFMSMPGVLVAQTTAAHLNHYYRSVIAANEFEGPAVVVCYASCIESHGIPQSQAAAQAKLAVDCRVFPIYMYDPRNGRTVRERLDLRGNPAPKEDWYTDSTSQQGLDCVAYARTEERFAGSLWRTARRIPHC